MQEIIKKYRKWKKENPDPDYQYDMIHDFFDGELSRGDLQSLAEFAEEKLTSTNSAIVQFTAEQLYSAAKDAGLHNQDIDDLISVIGKQHQ